MVVAHTFNPCIQEAEPGGSLSLWLVRATVQVQNIQAYTEKLCVEKKTKQANNHTEISIKLQHQILESQLHGEINQVVDGEFYPCWLTFIVL